MKRIWVCILAAVMLFSMTACGTNSEKKDVDGAAMVQALLNQVTFASPMSDMGDSAFLYFSNLPEGAQVKYYAGSGYYADAVALITLAKASDAAAAKTSVEAYIAQTRSQFANYIPEELGKIDKAVVWESGRYIILCITDDHVKAKKLLDSGDPNYQISGRPNNTTGTPGTTGAQTPTTGIQGTTGVQTPTTGAVTPPATTVPAPPATTVPRPTVPVGSVDANGYPIIMSQSGTWIDYGTGFIVDNAGFEVCGFSDSTASSYAALVNKVADALAGKTKVYSLAIPTGYNIMLPNDIQTQMGYMSPVTMIEKLDGYLNSNVNTVHAADNLLKHRNDYLYFRTDHHWNGKGAYYAYEAFCETKGIQPYTMAQREEVVREGFMGTLWEFSGHHANLSQPDTIYAYKPYSTSATMVYYDHNGVPHNWSIISGANNYNLFAGSDQPLAVFTNPQVTDGSVCVVVKESFGNALLPYLVDHYSTVYEVDYRYWTEDYKVDNMVSGDLVAFANQVGADDLIFANNLGMISTGVMVAKLARIIK